MAPNAALLLRVACVITAAARATRIGVRDDPSIEPWAYLNNGAFSGPRVPLSPDPLVSYQWWPSVNGSALQCFDALPVAVVALENAGAFENLESLMTAAPRVTVSGAGSFMVRVEVIARPCSHVLR